MKKIDILLVLFCLAASVLSASAFWQEYTRTLTKLNETPIATISFKKRTAQRKFIDRVIWDMLKQASDVYNGDTIRTIEASEAVISFRDEVTHITMNANTLIQVFYNDIDGAKIDFSGGNMEVNSGAMVVIALGSSEIVIIGQANLDKKDEGFALSVLEGEAVFNGEIIETGNLLILDERGERDVKPAIVITSLNTSMRITSLPGEITPVYFAWNAFNFDSDTFVIVETALDPAFKHIVQTANTTGDNVSIPMEIGEYFWRVYPASAISREPVNPIYPSGTLEIVAVRQIAETVQAPVAEQTEELEPQSAQSTQSNIETPAPVITSTQTTARLTGGEGVVASGTFSGNGNFYEVLNTRMTWEQAKAEAEKRGGHLATITSREENQFIVSLIRNTSIDIDCYWLGAQRIGRNWTWITGEPFSYRNWGAGQPDSGRGEDKISIIRYVNWGLRIGDWNDTDGNTNPSPSFIIEYPAE